MRQTVYSFLVLALAICVSPAQDVRRATAARTVQPPLPPDSGFTENTTFRTGDTFELTLGAVPPEGDLGFTKLYTVSGEGSVNVPYVGMVRATGLTQSQLETTLQNRLIEEKIFRWPTITINVPERARLITVGGQVRQPSRTYWAADITLMSAINAAGGPADFAGDKIRLIRNKKPQIFSRKKLTRNPELDPRLLPGDQIEHL